MGLFDNLTAAAKKGINNLEKMTDKMSQEWQHNIKPELNKQKNNAIKKIEKINRSTREEWENTFSPELVKARKKSVKRWNELQEIVNNTKEDLTENLDQYWEHLWNSKLGKDIKKYPVVQNITKEDIKEAGEIISEVIGIGSMAYTLVMLLTAWLPAIGLPISTAVAAKALSQIAQSYQNMSEEEQKCMRKVCSYIKFVFTGILHV